MHQPMKVYIVYILILYIYVVSVREWDGLNMPSQYYGENEMALPTMNISWDVCLVEKRGQNDSSLLCRQPKLRFSTLLADQILKDHTQRFGFSAFIRTFTCVPKFAFPGPF